MRFARLVDAVTGASGAVPAVVAAICLVVAWTAGLPFVHGGIHNDNYQLLINTTTTIITFVMVFFIQSSANRDSRALHTKIDALIGASRDVSSRLVGLEARPVGDVKAAQAEVRQHSGES